VTSRRFHVPAFIAIAVVITLSVAVRPAAQLETRGATTALTVFATVNDRQHVPIGNLESADFLVNEDGKDRQVLSAVPAAQPLQIIVLVDDNGTGIFRYGLARFAESMQGRAEMSIRVVTNQVQTVVNFTPDVKVWLAGISRLTVRPATPEGGQLIEGIVTAAADLRKREARRPVILALTVGGSEQSPRVSNDVLNELWRSRSALHVVFAETIARPAPAVTKPSDLLENNFNLSKVIGDGPKESGGIRRDVLTAGLVQTEVQQVATDLLSQYEITYARPVGGNAPRKLQVSVRRSGASVTAPTRAPAGQ
jgi:hypothetical protein